MLLVVGLHRLAGGRCRSGDAASGTAGMLAARIQAGNRVGSIPRGKRAEVLDIRAGSRACIPMGARTVDVAAPVGRTDVGVGGTCSAQTLCAAAAGTVDTASCTDGCVEIREPTVTEEGAVGAFPKSCGLRP